MAGAFSLLRGDDQAPLDSALPLGMLMPVLRWKRIAMIGSDFRGAPLAFVDTRVRNGAAWTMQIVERLMLVLCQYLRVLVLGHRSLSCVWKGITA